MNTFKNLIKHDTVDERITLRYKDKLPAELMEVWDKYGFGRLYKKGILLQVSVQLVEEFNINCHYQ
ncbi:GAD-like domain-containing protein [Peribacillus kribbensis]|uniref:GAD-like domain-containing protein n=1 Tax=Peribacillus kribbensis TaxID=356658 RepID=UPI0004106FDF|nr:GAD-like domain-containing protein [Peribacillus kribbensis]